MFTNIYGTGSAAISLLFKDVLAAGWHLSCITLVNEPFMIALNAMKTLVPITKETVQDQQHASSSMKIWWSPPDGRMTMSHGHLHAFPFFRGSLLKATAVELRPRFVHKL